MRFSDVVAQEEVKAILHRQADEGRLPHALLLEGAEGAGKLPLALALARYLLCESPQGGEPCEGCPSCRMTRLWAHPDLHFSFPVIKRKATDQPVSDDYLPQWREQLQESPYFSTRQWLARLGAENQQMQLFVGESDALQHKLSLKTSRGGKRIVVLWLPERMMEPCANKLLKLIEEPPPQTHFLMVSQQPELVLGTIMSRAQQLHVPPLSEEDISEALQRRGVSAEEADYTAHLAQGSYTQALTHTDTTTDDPQFQLFVSLMRSAYSRKIKDMTEWSEQAARLGRESQKSLLAYFQRMVRESFVRNLSSKVASDSLLQKAPEGLQRDSRGLNNPRLLNYMTRQESAFTLRFAPFINERNVSPIAEELARCQRDIEQNVNARMVFFDLIVKLTILIKQ
ncbi:MAG: DNA polymerase III subunit delta [Prevotellaceae bacterium]|nr:DNA polymerase III subunit delta [Prevotellaceae bacterium]